MLKIIGWLIVALILLSLLALFLGMTLGAVISLLYIGGFTLALLIVVALLNGSFDQKHPPE